jgi:hypothetical protein
MFEENWVTISPLASTSSSPVDSVESKETATKSSPTTAAFVTNALTRTLLIAPIVYKIMKINPVEHYYEIFLTLVVAWNQISEEDCWEPKLEEDIKFVDTIVQRRKGVIKSNFTFQEASTLVNCKEKTFPLQARVYCKLDMHDYPFNQHSLALPIHFSSHIHEVILEPHLITPSLTPIEDTWTLNSGLKTILTSVEVAENPTKSLLLEVAIHHNPLQCTQEVLLPTTILTCFAFACFYIDYEDIEHRLLLLFAVMMLLLVWKYTAPIPPVVLPYSTTMHLLASLQIAIVMGMGIESMMIVRMERGMALAVDETVAIVLTFAMFFFLSYLVYRFMCHQMMIQGKW